MKIKWEAKCNIVILKKIKEEQEEKQIAELTEILYDHFCQLERSKKIYEPIETEISPSHFTALEERTGTHG